MPFDSFHQSFIVRVVEDNFPVPKQKVLGTLVVCADCNKYVYWKKHKKKQKRWYKKPTIGYQTKPGKSTLSEKCFLFLCTQKQTPNQSL